MNLIITDKCTNSCPYCFAAHEMQKNKEQNILTKDSLDKFLNFLRNESSPIRLNIIGGEPLIYPHLEYLLERLNSEKAIVHSVFFTGGIVSQKVFDKLSSYNETTSLLFNLNERKTYMNPKHHDQVISNIEYAIRHGIRSGIGYNIYKNDFEASEIIKHCISFGIKDLRFAVACPVYNQVSETVVPPKGYKDLSERIFNFLMQCYTEGIHAHLDCTLPLCFFSLSQLGMLAKTHPQIISRMGKCGMPIDVNYDLSVFRCFSFSSHYPVKLTDFSSIDEIKIFFSDAIDSRLFKPKIKEECQNCQFATFCNGGCLSNNRNFLNAASKNEIMTQAYELINSNEYNKAIVMIEKQVKTITPADKLLLAHLYYMTNKPIQALSLIRETIATSKSATILKSAMDLQDSINKNAQNETKLST